MTVVGFIDIEKALQKTENDASLPVATDERRESTRVFEKMADKTGKDRSIE